MQENAMHENFPYPAPHISVSDEITLDGGTESLVPEAALSVNIATNIMIPLDFAKRGSAGITEYLNIILCDTSLRHPSLSFSAIVHPMEG